MPPKRTSKRLASKKVTPSDSIRQNNTRAKKNPPSVVPVRKKVHKASTNRPCSSVARNSIPKASKIMANHYAKKGKKKPVNHRWGNTKRKLKLSEMKPPPNAPPTVANPS